MASLAATVSNDPYESMLTTGELRAAYLSKERFIADITEVAGNMKESDRFTALLVLRALDLGREMVGAATSQANRKSRRVTL